MKNMMLRKNIFGFLKDGWCDKGKLKAFPNYEMHSFCQTYLHIAIHKDGSRAKYCPLCMRVVELEEETTT